MKVMMRVGSCGGGGEEEAQGGGHRESWGNL